MSRERLDPVLGDPEPLSDAEIACEVEGFMEAGLHPCWWGAKFGLTTNALEKKLWRMDRPDLSQPLGRVY